VRETVAVKARRLLVEGRVRIVAASEDDGHVAAEVRGDTARVYAVSFDAGDGGWSCSCAARTGCSHVRALQLVTVVEPRESR
jgi:uncharacterized Zn finger protein